MNVKIAMSTARVAAAAVTIAAVAIVDTAADHKAAAMAGRCPELFINAKLESGVSFTCSMRLSKII